MAFDGDRLEEAKIGILGAVVGASLITWALTAVLRLLPRGRRVRALLGSAAGIVDLARPVDPDRDHVRGKPDALVTMVEYGDFECPYCGLAEPAVRELLREESDIRFVWRHLPLDDVHPNARRAARAAEAAAEQGAFWEMHDVLMAHQDALREDDLLGYAQGLGLDTERFAADLHAHHSADRVEEDEASADLSAVTGTPTFFVNGRRHRGAYDIADLTATVHIAQKQAVYSPPDPPPSPPPGPPRDRDAGQP
jgi:protein-disulfide isomerase